MVTPSTEYEIGLHNDEKKSFRSCMSGTVAAVAGSPVSPNSKRLCSSGGGAERPKPE